MTEKEYLSLKDGYDIWEYDGPLLTGFTDVDGNPVLMYWVDYSDIENTWLVFWPDAQLLKDADLNLGDHSGKLINSLILSSAKTHLVSIGEKGEFLSSKEINILDYPQYIPKS